MLSASNTPYPPGKELNTFSRGAPAQLLFYVSVPGKGTDSIQDQNYLEHLVKKAHC